MNKEPILSRCCEKCSTSKYALKGKLKDKFRCGLSCDCHNQLESSDWMEEEREAFMNTGIALIIGDPMRKSEIADYWLTRMAEKTEAARKEEKNRIFNSLFFSSGGVITNNGQTLEIPAADKHVERGRAEERDRIVKMIEEMLPMAWFPGGQLEIKMIILNKILPNLKSNG